MEIKKVSDLLERIKCRNKIIAYNKETFEHKEVGDYTDILGELELNDFVIDTRGGLHVWLDSKSYEKMMDEIAELPTFD